MGQSDEKGNNAPAATDSPLAFPEKFADAVRLIYSPRDRELAQPNAFQFSSGVVVQLDVK